MVNYTHKQTCGGELEVRWCISLEVFASYRLKSTSQEYEYRPRNPTSFFVLDVCLCCILRTSLPRLAYA
jgi:hypothetical protein